MTDLSGLTPAEQVRALNLAVGDTIEGRFDYSEDEWIETRLTLLGIVAGEAIWDSQVKSHFRNRWRSDGRRYNWGLDSRPWRKISSDPTLDPAEPLRRELREAHRHIEDLYRTVQGCTCDPRDYEVEEWLSRNAAFGGQKGEE